MRTEHQIVALSIFICLSEGLKILGIASKFQFCFKRTDLLLKKIWQKIESCEKFSEMNRSIFYKKARKRAYLKGNLWISKQESIFVIAANLCQTKTIELRIE